MEAKQEDMYEVSHRLQRRVRATGAADTEITPPPPPCV
jgi:hypothetical protein